MTHTEEKTELPQEEILPQKKRLSFLSIRDPKKKGYLKDAFTGAVVMGVAKLAFSTSIRALDWGGIGTAVSVGLWSVITEVRKDYKAARQPAEGKDVPGRLQTLRGLWTGENTKKYAWKFLKGAAAGFVGALGMDMILEHSGLIGDTLKNVTAPIREFTKPLLGWLGGFFGTPPVPALAELQPPLLPEVTITAPPPVLENLTIAATAMDQLQALATDTDLSEKARATVQEALKGKSWAMNEAIDGMLNNRFGFTENKELAVQLTKQLAASGDEEGLLKLAYMQYQDRFAELGIAHDPDAARETVAKLGRSWYGGEAVLEDIQVKNLPPIPENIVIPDIEIPEIELPKEAMSCTALQSAGGTGFETACTPSVMPFLPGNTIGLTVEFNDGARKSIEMIIGPQAAEKPAAQYLQESLSSTLTQVLRSGLGALPPTR